MNIVRLVAVASAVLVLTACAGVPKATVTAIPDRPVGTSIVNYGSGDDGENAVQGGAFLVNKDQNGKEVWSKFVDSAQPPLTKVILPSLIGAAGNVGAAYVSSHNYREAIEYSAQQNLKASQNSAPNAVFLIQGGNAIAGAANNTAVDVKTSTSQSQSAAPAPSGGCSTCGTLPILKVN